MNFKIIMALMTVMSQAMLALADGKLTADEMLALLTTLLKSFGIDVGTGDLFGFEARDGGIYIKISKAVLDKIAVTVPME